MDLKLFGISQANCERLHQPNGLIDREIFEHWVTEIFIAEVTRGREKTAHESPAVLILDGCPEHDGHAL
jgi:hypothetical protein